MRDEWRIKCNKVFSDFVFPNILAGVEQVCREKSHLELPLYCLRMSGDFKGFTVCISVFCHQTAVNGFKKKHLNEEEVSVS